MNTFYERLNESAKNAGISLSALAEKLGLARSAATRWRNGGGMSEGNLLAASKILGVSRHWLETGKETTPVTASHRTGYQATSPVSASHEAGYEGEKNDNHPCNILELDQYEQALLELIKDQSADQKAMLLDIAKTLTKAK